MHLQLNIPLHWVVRTISLVGVTMRGKMRQISPFSQSRFAFPIATHRIQQRLFLALLSPTQHLEDHTSVLHMSAPLVRNMEFIIDGRSMVNRERKKFIETLWTINGYGPDHD